MASDKASLLKQRLRRGSDSFRFDALIEGVSTIEDSSPEAIPIESAATPYIESAEPAIRLSGLDPIAETVERDDRFPLVVVEDVAATTPAGSIDTDKVRLRWALTALTQRFALEIARFASALAARDAESAGIHLAQVNQALELLQPLDPTGELARELGLPDSPPPGKRWPSASWSFIEFAESPLSGLLPSGADERFVREVLYSAWGVPASPA